MRHSLRRATALALFGVLASVGAASAQSVAFRSITGTVVDQARRPIPGALVTLIGEAGGDQLSVQSSNTGRFQFGLASPGGYDIRVEAIGFRPLVAVGLTLADADVRGLTFRLTASAPPVVVVDTMLVSALGNERHGPGSVRLPSRQIVEHAYRYGDVAALTTVSPMFDASMGALGLPGDMTRVVADGVTFYRAPHPSARSEQLTGGPFSQNLLSGVTAYHNPSDIEWSSGAGAYVGVTTAGGTRDGVEIEGAYGGGPTWSSSELDITTPSLLSLQTTARAASDLGSGRTFLVAGDGLRHQTPFAPRVGESVAAELAGLDPDLLTSLTAPDVETLSRFSALARLDVQNERDSRMYLRAAGSFLTRSFDGAGPLTLEGAAAPPEESLDFSVAGGWISVQSSDVTAEFRGALSGSSRTFAGGEMITPAFLTGSGSPLGTVAATAGESSRTDLVLTPVLHYRTGPGLLKGGATLRGSRHRMAYSPAANGDFFFGDGGQALSGMGYGSMSEAAEASYLSGEFGLFSQYSATPSPGVNVSIGARLDYETFARADVGLQDDLLAVAGLSTDSVTNGYTQLGIRASLVWDPTQGAGPRIHATGSLQHGDMDHRAIAQLIGGAVDGREQHFAGAGIDWMAATLPAASMSRPSLTLFGPDARAPRSTIIDVGLSQPVAPGWHLAIGGTVRRTDFLMRSRDLNGPADPVAVDAGGRNVYGTLTKVGSVIATDADDSRRLPAFGRVWALDPDGWSEYRAVYGGLSHSSTSLDLYASYAFSETTDNWFGARAGHPGASLVPRGLDADDGTPWAESTSDFDTPHRISAGTTIRAGAVSISGAYRYRSGLPFTPTYRDGVDANGDGSVRNDPAFVPGGSELTMILDDWPCLEDQAGRVATRNSCRGPSRHSVDVRLRFGLGQVGGRTASLVIDGLGLIEPTGGVLDDALLLVDPTAPITVSPDGTTVTLPTQINPDFGQTRYSMTRGRLVRIGVRIGG